jgi:hypothetical protein
MVTPSRITVGYAMHDVRKKRTHESDHNYQRDIFLIDKITVRLYI